MSDNQEPVCILGGGLAGLSFAYFSGLESVMFEKEDRRSEFWPLVRNLLWGEMGWVA